MIEAILLAQPSLEQTDDWRQIRLPPSKHSKTTSLVEVAHNNLIKKEFKDAYQKKSAKMMGHCEGMPEWDGNNANMLDFEFIDKFYFLKIAQYFWTLDSHASFC